MSEKINAVLCLMNDYQRNIFSQQTKNINRKNTAMLFSRN